MITKKNKTYELNEHSSTIESKTALKRPCVQNKMQPILDTCSPLNISVKNHADIYSIYHRRQRSIIDTRLVKQTYVDSRYLLTCVGNSWQKNQGPYDSTYLNGV